MESKGQNEERAPHMEIRYSYVNKVLDLKGLHLKNYGNMTTNTLFISKCKHRDSLEDGHVIVHRLLLFLKRENQES